MPNRLARESSPYLLQHANNPVDWFPWGDEAFARARDEDKPIFLSVGYSTCHWCHVMEHESFENPAVASLLNGTCVPVKVDREERPDVDRVYMAFVQATTGAGGWPMSVWLTPTLHPFYGGTYFPPSSRWGRPGFADILQEISRMWASERAQVEQSGKVMVGRLREFAAAAVAPDAGSLAGLGAIEAGAHLYRQAFDRQHAGFGGAPKFPRPSELLFLLRAASLTEDDPLRAMVGDTLHAMASAGMYDHVGGGFHRYAVDAAWRVPHFEKMLYDQAQLVLALVETAQATGEAYWASVASDTIAYVERDLGHPDGGFYSAEDADSVPPEHAGDPSAHKTEGAFYLWGADAIDRLLGPDAPAARQYWGIEDTGNAPQDPQGEFGTHNILYIAKSLPTVAERIGQPAAGVEESVRRSRRRLFDERLTRPRPHLDDKVLTAWNGLMIAALARSARVLDGERTPTGEDCGAHYAALATRAAAFVREHLWDADRSVLLRRERGGRAGIDGYAEDYAFYIWGLLELFQTTGQAEWLSFALTLQRRQDELFWDDAGGGWFSTSGRDASILVRLKEDYDGAEPAAGSVAVLNLLVLGHLGCGNGLLARAERTLERLGPSAGLLARQMPFMLSNVAAWHVGLSQVVLVGPSDQAETRALRHVIAARFLPFTVVIPIEPGAPQEALSTVLPWVRDLGMRDGRPTAYVCRNLACDLPATTPEALAALLDGATPAGGKFGGSESRRAPG